MILAEDEKSDLSQVAISHLIRLIIIITVFPFVVNSFYEVENLKNVEEVLKNQSLIHLLILIVSSIILIYLFDKLRVPAALLSGTLVASGLLQITDIASYQISPDVIDYCLLIVGSSVGCRFADKTFNEIGKNALHSFVATFLLIILGLVAALAAGLIIDKNFNYKIRNLEKIHSFELKSLNLRSYYHNNILAFGDLLHKVHPLAGQGFNMTIRDIRVLSQIIKKRLDLGLLLDSSVNLEFKKEIKHKNLIFSNGIDLIHEFFNIERKTRTNFLSKSVKFIGNQPSINKMFTKIADKGILF